MHHGMLWLARSICPESASGEGFCRNQGTAYVDGAGTEGGLNPGALLPTIQFAQDKFLQKTVEVYLEQAQVSARSDGRTEVVVQLVFSEVIFCNYDKACLIKCA